jgi:hypothetical protein
MTMQSTVTHGLGAIAGLTLAALTAMPSQASSLSIGQNYQESSNVTSSAPPTPGACNGITYCYIEFNKVPAGKQLIVTQVSCSLNPSAGVPMQMFLAPRRPNNSAVERFQFLIPSTMPSTTPGTNVTVNTNTYQLFDQKDRPEIYLEVSAAASTVGFCTISGQMVDIP